MWRATVFLVILFFNPAISRAAPVAGDFVIRDFHFASGETLPELKLHYRTLGSPVRDRAGVVRNAVLILHGTGGSGEAFLRDQFAGELFGAEQLLDAMRYFVILPDGIGHGQSSKPSDGLHAGFPHYGYADMVRAQHALVTEHLRINHLRLILGTSMGAMHTWMWGEQYPDFMDALMPLASAPVQIAGRNRMWRRLISEMIRDDPEWKRGEYTTQPPGLRSARALLLLLTASPQQLYKDAPTRDAADQLLDRTVDADVSKADANDFLYAVESSRDYDPSPALETITAPLLAINSADDPVNPPELGIVENEIRRVKRGRFVLLPITGETRGHGTHSMPAIWKHYLAELLDVP